MKIFEFEQSEGVEIIGANSAKEAVLYYVNEWQDDLQLDDIVESKLTVRELTEEEISDKRKIFNEDKNCFERISYKEIAESATACPVVLVTPGY